MKSVAITNANVCDVCSYEYQRFSRIYIAQLIYIGNEQNKTSSCTSFTEMIIIQQKSSLSGTEKCRKEFHYEVRSKLVLLWAQFTKIYPPLPTSVQPISITKTLLIVPTKNERDPPLFIGKLLIKFQNILRNTTQVIIWHRVKILFSVISSPITLERQKWKSAKMKGILLSSPVNSW
jgi:hypothetical protein